MISKPNFELLLREGRSFEEYFRSRENNDALKAEEDILPKNDAPQDETLLQEDENPQEEDDPQGDF